MRFDLPYEEVLHRRQPGTQRWPAIALDHLLEFARQRRERIAVDSRDALERKRVMRSVNPAYIPRNHLVAEVIDAALSRQDFEPFHKLVDVLARPYEYDPERDHYARRPRPDQLVRQTFCGT